MKTYTKSGFSFMIQFRRRPLWPVRGSERKIFQPSETLCLGRDHGATTKKHTNLQSCRQRDCSQRSHPQYWGDLHMMMMILSRETVAFHKCIRYEESKPRAESACNQGVQGRCELHLSHKEITEYGAWNLVMLRLTDAHIVHHFGTV